jgi:hypothetical protein
MSVGWSGGLQIGLSVQWAESDLVVRRFFWRLTDKRGRSMGKVELGCPLVVPAAYRLTCPFNGRSLTWMSAAGTEKGGEGVGG